MSYMPIYVWLYFMLGLGFGAVVCVNCESIFEIMPEKHRIPLSIFLTAIWPISVLVYLVYGFFLCLVFMTRIFTGKGIKQ